MPSAEPLAQLLVLGGDTDGAGVHVAFAHHHAAQYDQGRGGETKLFRTQHRHQDDVSSSLQLTICLQANLSTQPVQHQGLLCFRKTQLWWATGIADRADRRGSCATLRSGNHDAIGFRFGHTSSDGTDTAFRN